MKTNWRALVVDRRHFEDAELEQKPKRKRFNEPWQLVLFGNTLAFVRRVLLNNSSEFLYVGLS